MGKSSACVITMLLQIAAGCSNLQKEKAFDLVNAKIKIEAARINTKELKKKMK